MLSSNQILWKFSLIMSIVIITVFSTSSFYHFSIFADDLDSKMYLPNSKPFNISYSEWLPKYDQWFINFSENTHPRNHYTPEKCAEGQSGPVWFLTDILNGTEVRSCTVPSDKAIFLPVLSGRCWSDVPPMTDQEITACAKMGNEYGLISATLDGTKLFEGNVKDLQNYRADSPYYNITVPASNIYGNLPGNWKAKSDGYFVFLKPLPPGNHSIKTIVSVLENPNPDYRYGATLTYNLLVK